MQGKRLLVVGGLVASLALSAFGVGATTMGVMGLDEVRSTLAQEQIVGTPDSAIAGQKVDTGGEAKAFAATIRKHTLESTEGQTYAQMGRFLTAAGEQTNDEALAAKDPQTGRPVANKARELWVTSTALQTALNTSFFAERVAVFSIVMGVSLLLTGIGFGVLTLAVLRRVEDEPAAATAAARTPAGAAPQPA
jgi:hypothetical protein